MPGEEEFLKSIGATTVEEHEASKNNPPAGPPATPPADPPVELPADKGAESPATPPATPPAEAPTNEVNWEELTGGRFKTKEDFDSGISNYGNLQAEVTALRKLDPSKAFANDDVKKYNNFVKATGVSDPLFYQRVRGIENPQSLSKAEQIALSQIIDTPELSTRYSELVADIEKSYGIDKEKYLEEDENYSPRYSELDLIRDSSKASKTISDFYSKISGDPEGEPQDDLIQSYAARRQSWGKAQELITKNKYTAQFSDGADGQLNFDLPSEDVQEAAREVSGLFAESGLEVNDDSIKNYAALVEMVAIGRAAKAGKLSQGFRGHYEAKAKKDADKQFHNPADIESTRKPDGTQKPSLQEENFQKAMNELK